MIVKQIYITRETWNNGKLKGEIIFIGNNSEIKLQVSEEMAAKVVDLLADEIVACSQEIKTITRAEVLSSQLQIEGK